MREAELKKIKPVQEGLADLADKAEKDHEVQMARAELYKAAKYSIKLHEMLQGVSEQEGLEGWVQSKITKAADYLSSVFHHLDYQAAEGGDMPEVVEGKDTTCSDKCCGSDVKAEDCKCPPTCKHCDCNAVSEGKGKSNKQKAAIAIAKKEKGYKESLVARLEEKKKKSPAGGPACWKGKKIHPTKPTKMKGGKRVNNCIDAG